jgi:hypothetical protein
MSQNPEALRLHTSAEQRAERSPLLKILEFLLLAFCTLTFLLPSLTTAGILLGKNAVNARDYIEYWASGQQLVHHGDPYDGPSLLPVERAGGLPDGVDVIITPNPPTSLPLMLPLGFVSAMDGSRLWSLLLFASFVASVRMVRAMHGSPKNYLHWLGYSFAPAIVCLARGQVGLLILLGLVLFLRLYRTRPWLAGASLWLCALKPHLFLPFGVVLVAWVIASRSYKVLLGAGGAIALSAAMMTYVDHGVWTEYTRSMNAQRLDKIAMPCLSHLLRQSISPDSLWLQYVPAAVGCIWALAYFRRHKDDWDWWEHGSLVVLVSVLVAPYTWLIDQTILILALLHAVYVSRSRAVIAMLALASAAIQLSPFVVQELTHSVLYAWTAPAWLAIYLVATRSSSVSRTAVAV